MTRRQADARDKLAGLAARAPDSPQPDSERPASTRTSPIRMSVDWLPADHRRIKTACTDIADTAGRASLPASDLVRAAVGLVLNDADLLDRLRADLAVGKGRL